MSDINCFNSVNILKFSIDLETNYVNHPYIYFRNTYLNMDILVRRLVTYCLLSIMVKVFYLR